MYRKKSRMLKVFVMVFLTANLIFFAGSAKAAQSDFQTSLAYLLDANDNMQSAWFSEINDSTVAYFANAASAHYTAYQYIYSGFSGGGVAYASNALTFASSAYLNSSYAYQYANEGLTNEDETSAHYARYFLMLADINNAYAIYYATLAYLAGNAQAVHADFQNGIKHLLDANIYTQNAWFDPGIPDTVDYISDAADFNSAGYKSILNGYSASQSQASYYAALYAGNAYLNTYYSYYYSNLAIVYQSSTFAYYSRYYLVAADVNNAYAINWATIALISG